MNDLGERLRRASEGISPSEGQFERLLRRRDRRKRRERLLAIGVSFALVAGVVGGVLFTLSKSGSRTGHRTPLDGHSSRTGQAGQANQALALGDGQYLYVRFHQVMPGFDFTQQSWWATDGSGRTQFDCSTEGCMDPNCQGQDGCSGYGGPPNKTYGPGEFPTDDDLTGLSTDPDELLPQLLARTAPGGESPEPAFSPGPELTPGVTVGGLLYAIESILTDPNGSPDLKAAVYTVAAGLDGVTVHDGATDPAGRPATLLEWSLDGSTEARHYFDPDTHLLMASSWAGQDDTYAVYDQGIVGSTDAIPTGDQWFFPESDQGGPTP